MTRMGLNYFLLLILGGGFIVQIIKWKRTGIYSTRLLRPIVEVIVFILALVATFMGVDFMTFRQMLAM